MRAIRILDDVTKVESILNRGSSHHLLSLIVRALLLLLLYLFHPLAPEVLKVPQTSIVLDVVNHRSKVLLLCGSPYSLVHHLKVWLLALRSRCCRLVQVLKVLKGYYVSSSRSFANNLRNHIILVAAVMIILQMMSWGMLLGIAKVVTCIVVLGLAHCKAI